MSSHRFIWRRPIASSVNFGALISVLKSLGAVVVFKVGSQTSDACAEAIMRTPNRLLLAGFCRRWREGTTSMMMRAIGGFEHCGAYKQCYSASTFLAWSSIWDTSA